jgi:hypothetical protein
MWTTENYADLGVLGTITCYVLNMCIQSNNYDCMGVVRILVETGVDLAKLGGTATPIRECMQLLETTL